ncbi:hypothetical protein CDCA_CDCA17G4336 [Cyanidium caldarium]|uniref:Sucrose transporter n=1 Tax=Cyanidium caldarium TaxID=2771 RepID=A0AAV9J1Q8_CYACA|nr:hypothetical protein CDCA_CDCA17G4336 [Cyanidium caldarium]
MLPPVHTQRGGRRGPADRSPPGRRVTAWPGGTSSPGTSLRDRSHKWTADATPESSEELPLGRLLAITCCTLGQAFAWACQFSFMTPHFLMLGVEKEFANFLWIAGPVSGLVVQPIIGAASDRCRSRIGRRRPFLLGGLLFMALGLLSVAVARPLGRMLFGDAERDATPLGALVVSIAGFWIIDLSNNAIQASSRTLVADLAAPEQQELGAALTAFWLSVGNLLGFYVGGNPWLYSWIPLGFSETTSVFIIAIAVLIPSCAVTLLGARETPLDELPSASSTAAVDGHPDGYGDERGMLVEILRALADMPRPVWSVCLVQFFSFIAFFSYQINASAWFGENVFRGRANVSWSAPQSEAETLLHRFERGVQMYSTAMAIQSLVTLMSSAMIPCLSQFVGLRATYLASQLWLAACLLLATLVVRVPVDELRVQLAVVILAATGFPWAATLSIPYAIVAREIGEQDRGLFLGILNIAIVVPQMLVAVLMGVVLKIAGGDFTAAFVVGGIAALMASACVLRISRDVEPLSDEDEDEETAAPIYAGQRAERELRPRLKRPASIIFAPMNAVPARHSVFGLHAAYARRRRMRRIQSSEGILQRAQLHSTSFQDMLTTMAQPIRRVNSSGDQLHRRSINAAVVATAARAATEDTPLLRGVPGEATIPENEEW